MPEIGYVNRRIVVCKNGHEVHENAVEYVDQWGVKRKVLKMGTWKCRVCGLGPARVLFPFWKEVDFKNADIISRGGKF